MKKRILFDVLALLAIVVGFLVLFYFQDMDFALLTKLKNSDKASLVDKTVVENSEYVNARELEEDVKQVLLPKQTFTQPDEEEFVNCYCYSVLSDEEKSVYQEIYIILKEMKENSTLSTIDVDMIEKAFQCVLNDHPQFYYVKGYTYTTYATCDVITRLDFSGTYTKTKEECDVINTQIDSYVEECFLGMPEGLSDYEKVKYIYDYIILNTEYNLNAEDSQNICSVFLNGESVCMGYARAMQYLLLEQNILCTIVNGTAGEMEEHAWNLLLLDGQYYHLDVTWGDDSYIVTNDSGATAGMVNYGFFCVTTEEILNTHTINNIVALPPCIADENNYYVKEGYYFTSVDTEKLATIFDTAYGDQKEYVEIKCSDGVVYREMCQFLIEEQHIFDYLESSKDTVSYYDGKELLLLEFWLK